MPEEPGKNPDPNTPDPGKSPEEGKDPEEGKTFDYNYVKELREENKGWRTKFQGTEKELKELRTKLQTIEDAKLSDQEKRDKDMKELQERVQGFETETRKLKVTTAVAKAGAINPERVARLVDETAEDLEKEIQAVKKEYPTLFRDTVGNGGGDGGAGNGSRAKGTDMNSMLRKAAGRA